MMEKQNENQLGNRIAELRKEAGLTQEQLAGKLGVTYQAVSKWENGNSYPDISLLPRLSEIFQVSLDSLFGKEDTILTERVLEKAVRAAAWEEEDSQQAEDLEPAPQTQGQTPCEDGAQMDMAQEDTASQQQRESTEERVGSCPFLWRIHQQYRQYEFKIRHERPRQSHGHAEEGSYFHRIRRRKSPRRESGK